MLIGPLNCAGSKKFEFLKIQDGSQPLFKNCLYFKNAIFMQPVKQLQQNFAG